MRVLWTSNFSTQSGYANQARLFVSRLKALGHHVTVFEIGGGGGMPRVVDGVQVIPPALDPLGNDILAQHAEALKSDIVFTLTDTWAFNPETMRSLNWFPFTPIDHTPVPPLVKDRLKAARSPIAISPFGVRQLREAGFSPYYVPHAVDPAVWFPRDRARARRELNVPDESFWVSFVGVNDTVPSRKGIGELLMAWQLFQAKHPDAVLYLHTSQDGNLPINNVGGVRIDLLCTTLGIPPDSVRIVDAYAYRTGIPASYLANMASASDVLILPTRGEGFGLPLIEFQRCGCPVITTDFAAGADFCASGWLLEWEADWSWQSAFYAKPSVLSIYERLEEAYARRGDEAIRRSAVELAREYDIDVVQARYLVPVMRDITERLLEGVKVS